jgi:tRNA-dihydrouridine synthase B
VEVCRTHLHKSIEWKGPVLGILEMRRHYANYLKGLPHIKEYRNKLVTVKTREEVDALLDEVKIKFSGIEIEQVPVSLSDMPVANCAY